MMLTNSILFALFGILWLWLNEIDENLSQIKKLLEDLIEIKRKEEK